MSGVSPLANKFFYEKFLANFRRTTLPQSHQKFATESANKKVCRKFAATSPFYCRQLKMEMSVYSRCTTVIHHIILVVSEIIWNCREKDENNVHLKHALWRTVFETIWNCSNNMKTWKQGRLRVQYVARWYDSLTCRENVESNEAKWCILTILCSTTFRGSDSRHIVLPTRNSYMYKGILTKLSQMVHLNM